jgi:hypothetical protein
METFTTSSDVATASGPSGEVVEGLKGYLKSLAPCVSKNIFKYNILKSIPLYFLQLSF